MITAKYDAKYASLYEKADAAGRASAAACTPTPMIVGTPTTPLGNDIDPAKPTYFVSGGVCGFAWVWLKGNTGFARWAKAEGLTSKGYPTGLTIRPPRTYGQSMQRKEAYAHGFAAVLREAGIDCHVESRMD